MKPRLVVSNGDVLADKGFYHYLISAGIWLPLSLGLLALIYYTLLPKPHREVWRRKEQSVSLVALLWGLALFFLSAGLLPFGWSLIVSAGSLAAALVWARRMLSRQHELIGS